MIRQPPGSTLSPYPTLFRSEDTDSLKRLYDFFHPVVRRLQPSGRVIVLATPPEQAETPLHAVRSEEHTSELQSANISYAVFCLKKKNTLLNSSHHDIQYTLY